MQKNAWGWPFVAAGAAMFVIAALGGCPHEGDHSERTAPGHVSHAEQAAPGGAHEDDGHDAIYARADLEFASAILYKPAPAGDIPARLTEMAPLIVRRTTATSPSPTGLLVRASAGNVKIDDNSFEQLTYLWSDEDEPDTPLNGVRITIDAGGFPVIYEVLKREHGTTLLFVAKSIEESARESAGPPPPGRRFAVERSIADAPNVVVARVIEDGPQPMGPIVYISADGATVETLICRCMNSQVDSLAADVTYPLLADDTAAPPPADLSSLLRLPPRR